MRIHLIIYIAVAMLLAVPLRTAAEEVSVGSVGIGIRNVSMKQDLSEILVGFTFDFDGFSVKSNRAVLLTPGIVGAEDSVSLPSVGIYGRRRYYYYKRNNADYMLSGSSETVIRKRDLPDTLRYEASAVWREWMKNCRLKVYRQDYGCCNEIVDESETVIYSLETKEYKPTFIYVRPKAEGVKMRSLSGSAYINFPVNKTYIKPDYMNNPAELAKVDATIRAVKDDSDTRITSMSIKGYASPEGSYENNSRLAEGRTEALKQYVLQQYDMEDSIIHTFYEPENWVGFKKYVEESGMVNRNAILNIIKEVLDGDADADEREHYIRDNYPDDYGRILADCYPSLRRSDYKVEYIVRSFSDIDEIRRLIHTAPQKLSLEEFYLAAQSLEPGTEEYDTVFDTAVRMFPDDETANINAANSAMSRGDLVGAKRFLDKAGQSPEAVYARGVHAALSGDEELAERLFKEAAKEGVAAPGQR